MDVSIVIGIVGSFLALGLTVNGFFLKNLLSGQNKIEIDLAKLMVKVENYSGRIDTLEHNLRKMELEQVECRGKCVGRND